MGTFHICLQSNNSGSVIRMNRRDFLEMTSSAAWSVMAVPLLGWSQARSLRHAGPTFPLALAEPLRHQHPSQIAADLARYPTKGYTGIWIENDYVRWTLNKDPDQGFNGCWRLFNIFDFTFSKARDIYCGYLADLSRLCAQHNLDIWASFWVPLPNVEMFSYLRQHRPKAIGKVTANGKVIETLCTCRDGDGLAFIGEMFTQFLDRFPQVKGVKIATEDNGARICDETCPNAHGTTEADHIANLFGEIDRSLRRRQQPAQLMLFPWFWRTDFREKILAQLQGEFLVLTKREMSARQTLPIDGAGDPFFDNSIVSEQTGPDFLEWLKYVGPARIIDMVPVGSGVDDMFFNYPPYPGRIYRRLRDLRSFGVTRFLDSDGGGHSAGSNEEAVSVFSQDPACSESTLLQRVAKRLYNNLTAQSHAIQGWMSFDKGFGELPIGLAHTGAAEFTGRFGFAWPMCVATPLVPSAFADKDRKHEVFWFSPYNFFTFSNSPRLKFHFDRVQKSWNESLKSMDAADQLEHTESSSREFVAVKAHCLGVQSVLNWCAAAMMANDSSTRESSWVQLFKEEIAITKEFQSLQRQYPWVWANVCWEPAQSVLHQKQLGFTPEDRDPFVAKIRILEAALESRS